MWGVWGGAFNFTTKSLDNGTVSGSQSNGKVLCPDRLTRMFPLHRLNSLTHCHHVRPFQSRPLSALVHVQGLHVKHSWPWDPGNWKSTYNDSPQLNYYRQPSLSVGDRIQNTHTHTHQNPWMLKSLAQNDLKQCTQLVLHICGSQLQAENTIFNHNWLKMQIQNPGIRRADCIFLEKIHLYSSNPCCSRVNCICSYSLSPLNPHREVAGPGKSHDWGPNHAGSSPSFTCEQQSPPGFCKHFLYWLPKGFKPSYWLHWTCSYKKKRALLQSPISF